MDMRHPLATTIALAASLAACDASSAAAPAQPADPRIAANAVVPLDPFGLNGVTGRPGDACVRPEHRQFDFWLGEWDVLDPTGETLLGTNVVERALDGCLVTESWTDAGGNRGRSINSYDAAEGSWVQMWVAAGGGFGGVLIMEGGLRGNRMVMSGDRVFADFPGFVLRDTYEWTPLEDGTVRQYATVEPEVFSPWDGRYHRRDAITPAPEVINPTCGARAASRELDFLLGRWRLSAGKGEGSANAAGAGSSIVTTDLSRCLIEERVSGPNGYEGWSFAVWSAIDHDWHRTYADNLGRRLVLRGGRSGDAIVLAGTRRGANGEVVDVRVSWAPSGTGVVQRWEYSRDGGATWAAERTVHYVPD
ncbi:MAG TPA: hypothetical protein VFZ11_11600 [Gemmatimonadaceae bacterium]